MAYDAPSGYREQVSHDETTHAATTHATTSALALARVLEVDGDRARISVGAGERWASIDPSVDPALLESARQSGARAVVELGAETALLVGTLMTARAPEIDRQGDLELHVQNFVVQAEEVLLKTPRTFLRLRRAAAELFADELVARGRILTRILGKAIKLN